MKKQIKIIGMIFSIFSLIFSGCGEHQQEAHAEKHEEHSDLIVLHKNSLKDISLEISVAEEQKLTGNITAPAKLIASQDLEALVGSHISGRVHRVLVNTGDHVNRGQILMYIEGLEIGDIRAGYIKAKAELEYTQSNYNRQKALLEQNVGAQKSLYEARAMYEKAQAEFNAEDKRIHSIGLTDNDILKNSGKESHTAGILPVKSPISGIVVERNVVIGQPVEPNTNAFRIINTSTLWADAQIYEKDLPLISGKPEINLKVTAFAEETFKGRIIYTGETIESDSRTIKIRAIINNPGRKLKPEMFGEMLIPVSSNAKGIVVPAEALVKEGEDQFLFKAENDTSFRKVMVLAGSSFGDKILIKEGIKSGDRIVTKGTFYLKSESKKDELEEHEH